MPGRAIKREMTNGKAQIVANKRTEGHGLIPTGPTNDVINTNIPPTLKGSLSNNINNIDNHKFLKVLKPKSYIHFD